MRHSRACIKSKLDRSEQLVYVPWDTLAHIFIFHVFREGYKYFYIYTHTYIRAWVSKLTFQKKFSGYVRSAVHPLLSKPICSKHRRILSEEPVSLYRKQRAPWLAEVMSWRLDGAHYLHSSIQVFLKNGQGEEKAPTEHKAQRTSKGLGVNNKKRKKAKDVEKLSIS